MDWTLGFEQYPTDTDYGFVTCAALRDLKSASEDRIRKEHTVVSNTSYDYVVRHDPGKCGVIGLVTDETKAPVVFGAMDYTTDGGVLYFDDGISLYALAGKGHAAYIYNLVTIGSGTFPNNVAHYATGTTSPLYLPKAPANSFEATLCSASMKWLTGLPTAAASYWIGGVWADSAVLSQALHFGAAAAVTGMGAGGIQHDDSILSHSDIASQGLFEPGDINFATTSIMVSVPGAGTVVLTLPRRSMYPGWSMPLSSSVTIRPHYVAALPAVDYIPTFDLTGNGTTESITCSLYYMGA